MYKPISFKPINPLIFMKKILIIVADFYKDIGQNLQQAAIEALNEAGYRHDIIVVPGCFELPSALSMVLASNRQYAGFIALGCVIKGETSHYDYVCGESARGLSQIAIEKKIALGFGVITANNKEQANARCQNNAKNYGTKAAKTCIEMLKIKESLA